MASSICQYVAFQVPPVGDPDEPLTSCGQHVAGFIVRSVRGGHADSRK
jgi:hypothetical protein